MLPVSVTLVCMLNKQFNFLVHVGCPRSRVSWIKIDYFLGFAYVPKCFGVVHCDSERSNILSIPLPLPHHLIHGCQRGRSFGFRTLETFVSNFGSRKANCSQLVSTVVCGVSIFPTLNNKICQKCRILSFSITWLSLLIWENVCQRIRSCSAYLPIIDVYWEA